MPEGLVLATGESGEGLVANSAEVQPARMERRAFSRIDLTPLVGVLLVLFVVLLAIHPGPTVGADVVQNPSDPAPGNPPLTLNPVLVHVSRTGAVAVDGKPSSFSGLAADVAKRRAELSEESPGVPHPSFGIYVDADNDAPYDQAFQAYRTLQRAGYRVAYGQRYLNDQPRQR
ncbi:MAG: biopolymer transporter ExbD [Caulobacter sp.]|nr:biopolymer transporter ExbD [Caulobacter sp.]